MPEIQLVRRLAAVFLKHVYLTEVRLSQIERPNEPQAKRLERARRLQKRFTTLLLK